MYKKSGEVFIENGRYWIKLEIGRQRYHRYLMEQKLGRKLLPEENIHHIDEDKLNNDLGNLQIMSNSEHRRLHQTGNHNKRCPASDETKLKQSKIHKKRYESIEERKKHSATMKEWWRLRKEKGVYV